MTLMQRFKQWVKKTDQDRNAVVQALIFDSRAHDVRDAKQWARFHGYTTSVSKHGRSIVMKQLDSSKYKAIKTVDLDIGIKAVIAKRCIDKSQPTSSNVHVPATGEEDKITIKTKNGTQITMGHDKQNLESLKDSFDQFIDEEELEKSLAGVAHQSTTKKQAKARAITKADDVRRVAKVAVMNDGWLLMGKRRDNGKWTLPGGHVDKYETMKEGAMRELEEETGIQAIPQDILPLTDTVQLKGMDGAPLIVQGWKLFMQDRGTTSMRKDPDAEVERWRWINANDGLPEEIMNNLHVPIERCTVLQALGMNTAVEKSYTSEVDRSDQIWPNIDNLDSEIIKAAYSIDKYTDPDSNEYTPDDANETPIDIDMQRLVEGTDWELEHTTQDQAMAKDAAMENLQVDPNHYRELMALADGSDDVLTKDTEETEEDPFAGEGYCFDLGSGNFREPGHIGLDLYPYDHGTVVHDLHLGIPAEDNSAKKIKMSNSLHEMDELSQDPHPLLQEIHRVLQPGGMFTYDGPEEIYDPEYWSENYPGLVMINSEGGIEKDNTKGAVRQQFTKIAVPDPATANDAEPRIGLGSVDMLPSDTLLAADALGYAWSDATSSGRGNRLLGYPSQGALESKVREETDNMRKEFTRKDCGDDSNFTMKDEKMSYMKKVLKSDRMIPIFKANNEKQIVYGVILEPNDVDAQDDYMDPDEIEKSAHKYMTDYRVIGSDHEKSITARPVESFIAPQDFEMSGQYGHQTVKKGSWVLGVKVDDPKEWAKIKSGEYTGFSVGGLGERQAV